jgi:hypothetical protein
VDCPLAPDTPEILDARPISSRLFADDAQRVKGQIPRCPPEQEEQQLQQSEAIKQNKTARVEENNEISLLTDDI